jgi:hypothetical protein
MGQPCYLQLVPCSGRDTVVPAHSNQSRHGRGFSFKSHDLFTVPACHACHQALDHGKDFTREQKADAFQRAWEAWMLHLFQSGKVMVT